MGSSFLVLLWWRHAFSAFSYYLPAWRICSKITRCSRLHDNYNGIISLDWKLFRRVTCRPSPISRQPVWDTDNTIAIAAIQLLDLLSCWANWTSNVNFHGLFRWTDQFLSLRRRSDVGSASWYWYSNDIEWDIKHLLYPIMFYLCILSLALKVLNSSDLPGRRIDAGWHGYAGWGYRTDVESRVNSAKGRYVVHYGMGNCWRTLQNGERKRLLMDEVR